MAGKVNNGGLYEALALKTESSEAPVALLPALRRELVEHRKRQAAAGFELVRPDGFVFIPFHGGGRGRPLNKSRHLTKGRSTTCSAKRLTPPG